MRVIIPFLSALVVSLQALGDMAATPAGMALVPGGRYAPPFRADNGPAEIAMSPFYLDVFPVTNADFLEFVRANPKWRRTNVKPSLADTNYLKLWTGDLVLGPAAPSNAPVTFVSWFAARAYCAWKGKRLPTTAEWEYAAAASTTRPDGRNDPEFRREVLTWYAKPSIERLPSVGLGNPNYFGLHDLHGLVWEWVADFNRTMMSGVEKEAFCGGGSEGAVDRGDYPAFMRYGFRSSLKADYTVHNLGFRCAKDL